MAQDTPPSQETDSSTSTLTPNKEQTNLYQRAVEAYQSGDYSTTVALLETANAIQPFNLFSYNIARANMKLGRCKEAQAAYNDAMKHPVLGPPITREIEQGLEELESACPGTATVSCAAPGLTQLELDGNEQVSCTEFENASLKAGTHVIIATLDDQLETYPFEVVGMQNTEVVITLVPQPKPKPFASKRLGKPIALAGSGLLIGALILDNTLVRRRRQEFAASSADSLPYDEVVLSRRRLRRAQALTLTAGSIGTVSAILGYTLWLRASFDNEAASASLTLTF